MFRSSLNCATSVQFTVSTPSTSTWFYYTASSATDTTIYWRLLNHRVRTCSGITPYYRPSP